MFASQNFDLGLASSRKLWQQPWSCNSGLGINLDFSLDLKSALRKKMWLRLVSRPKFWHGLQSQHFGISLALMLMYSGLSLGLTAAALP